MTQQTELERLEAAARAADAAWDAVFAQARDAARSAQTAEFLRVVTETECCEAIRARGNNEQG